LFEIGSDKMNQQFGPLLYMISIWVSTPEQKCIGWPEQKCITGLGAAGGLLSGMDGGFARSRRAVKPRSRDSGAPKARGLTARARTEQ
jgi:hypothetical protein